MRRRQFLAAGAAGLAGCVAVPDADDSPSEDEPPSSEELLQEAIHTRVGLRSLEARRTMTMETPAETAERTDRIVQEPPGKQRLEVLESDDPDTPPGTVSVRSLSTTWEYYPDEGMVAKRHHPNRVVADRTRLVLEDLLEDYDLEYVGGTGDGDDEGDGDGDAGLDTVDGRPAHRIDATPETAEIERSIDLLVGETIYRIPLEETPVEDLEDVTVSRAIWIDDEHRYPVKECNAVRNADGEVLHRVTVTYEDLAIDAGLAPGTFSYEPPADAEVVEIGTEPEGVFDSVAAAEAAAPYDLPDPDVPDPYALDRVTVVDKGEEFGTTTTLWYVDPDRTERDLFLAVREQRRFDADVLEETDLEFEGNPVYRRDGRIESLFWDCGDLNYELSIPAGPEMEEDSLSEIAPSVGCS
ncbi:DUF2092 domain-containing protein [Halobiforma lacisalsi AJ5]|uniref:DUF2092 domain-containing protein n=1 Tax=Natronobacterium lacisalsi AJ5 TaxID=358396 RepID=M0LEM0_NATLA|nr:hypothetical protein [Halobiforma lacisalsi]APW99428.1 DUF2092 domain-containing protein [Halobiforma lacisalsi AJ5]EMA31538.1 hypothetical protein C445_13687 [Halobiforma lacisalsi AJ5]